MYVCRDTCECTYVRTAEFAAHICLDKRDEQIKSNDL